jgi:hypothetical protein
MHVTPPHSFSLQYAPDLTAPDDDTVLSGRGGKRIQCPVGFLLLIASFQLAASAANQPSRWIGGYQRDNPGTFGFREPGLTSGTRAITKAVYPLSVKAVNTPAHRLRMTSQLSSDFSRAKSAPAKYDHAGALYPVCRSVTAVGQLTQLLLLEGILGGVGVE